MRSVGLRHVFGESGMRAALVGAHVTGDALTAVEHFHCGRTEASPELLAYQGVRDAVIVAVDVNMVVKGSSNSLPLRIDIGRRGQRSHGRPINLFEDGAPTAGELLKGTLVELCQQRSDRCIQLLQAEEALVP